MVQRASNTSLLAFLALLVVVTLFAFMLLKPMRLPSPNGGGPSKTLSDEQLRELVEQTNAAVGHLENENLVEADKAFQALASAVPDQPLPRRNLAVARVLAFRDAQTDRAAVDASLEELARVEPDGAALHWLRAQVALRAIALAPDAESMRAERASAMASFGKARELAPGTVSFGFEMFEASKTSSDDRLLAQGLEALEAAYRLEPDNLFVLSEWLLHLAQQQDPAIIETLTAAKSTIAPLRRLILKHSRTDIIELTDQAIEAAGSADWPKVVMNVRIAFLNLIRPQDFAQSDKRKLLPHPLEFALQEYGGELGERIAAMQPASSEPIAVELVEAAAGWKIERPDLVDVLLVDFDLDGRLELLTLSDTRVEVFRQVDDSWQPMVEAAVPPGSRGLLAADLDRDRDKQTAKAAGGMGCFDADVDVVVYGSGGIRVFENRLDAASGDRQLVSIEQTDLPELRDIVTAILVDFDHDSDLDLMLGCESGMRVLLSGAPLMYSDVTEYSELPSIDSPATSLVAVDWDRDADIDIVAIFPASKRVGYLENLRHGNFRWVDFGDGFDELRDIRTVRLLDADGNASWDLLGAGAESQGLRLVRSMLVSETNQVDFVGSQSFGDAGFHHLVVLDFDNDGFDDALAWNEAGVEVFRGGEAGRFTLDTNVWPAEFAESDSIRSCDFGDIDLDGDLDLCLITESGVSVLRNDGGNANHWISVRALGQFDSEGKANHNGIGSLLEVRSGSRYQARIVTRPTTHFGLGSIERADVLRFLWTNGVPQAKIHPETNQVICEEMILKGSCPYLYTWDGEKFVFGTDLLWASPIGLQVADGVLAAARPWEYLKVDGRDLAARDGRYHLRITEELWEAAYFDRVALFAVDHPEDVDIFTNEKVGPPSIAEHKILTVRERRYPVAARDKFGRDVLDQVRARDGNYFRGYERQRLPGLVDEHFLELDFCPLNQHAVTQDAVTQDAVTQDAVTQDAVTQDAVTQDAVTQDAVTQDAVTQDAVTQDAVTAGAEPRRPRQLTLFLTGWIFPTDTSLNIAISQDPTLEPPRPPSIQVPDGNGQWQEVVEFMGFPGGKTKTIAVDLSNVFLVDDYRLRIVTSNEIYWDEAFVTVDEQPAEVRVTELEMVAAELSYRGISAPQAVRRNAPQTYDYDRVTTDVKWPPMRGGVTRFGDVLPLLQSQDDRLAVITAGDDIAIEFAVPAQDPPPAWRRDFVLHNVGWDKDADLNTIYGQSVEPLPYVGMPGYPYVVESYPDSSRHQQYLRTYQTRKIDSRAFWRQLQLSSD